MNNRSDKPILTPEIMAAFAASEGCSFLGCGAMIFLILLGCAVLRYAWP